MNSSNFTGRTHRTLQEAFGPYCDSRIAETKPQRPQPWGCGNQGRHQTRSNPRYDHWAADEWRDGVDRNPVQQLDGPEYEAYIPVTAGDWAMAVAIVGVIAWVVSMGSWL